MSGAPEYYTGCIRNLQVNNVIIPLEKQNIEGRFSFNGKVGFGEVGGESNVNMDYCGDDVAILNVNGRTQKPPLAVSSIW